MNNLIGRSLGRYHILEQLGEGGMAIVYKAYDTRLEADVAVKVIRTENILPSTLERTLKRFEREAKSLAKLTHPNIIKVIDYGEYEGKPYLVMPYLPGGTLKERLKDKPMPWQEAARLLIPIARALDFAHRQGLIHRDVKPSNIIITADGDPMLTDFGIAKILDLEETVDLTGTNAAVGTPEYMAPEQSTSNKVDHRADIYALGVVFYEMVAGRKPYIADTPMAVLIKHASEPLPRPRQYVPNLPQAVENVLLKALVKNPSDRYQSMGEFTAALERLVSGKAPKQDLAGIKAGVPRLIFRNPAFWITVCIVGIALIGISIMWFSNRNGGVTRATNVSLTTPSPKESMPTPGDRAQLDNAQTLGATAPTSAPTFRATQKTVSNEDQLALLCGTSPIHQILTDFNIVFYNDFSNNTTQLENWGADVKLSDGVLVNTGHNHQWKAMGRGGKMSPEKGFLIRFRPDGLTMFHIYLEQPAYGQASHRWWGITGDNGVLEPEAYFGANFSPLALDWQQNDLPSTVTDEWLCAFLKIEGTTFTTKIWNPNTLEQSALAVKDMGMAWNNFDGLSAFASEQGTLDVDVYSELASKK